MKAWVLWTGLTLICLLRIGKSLKFENTLEKEGLDHSMVDAFTQDGNFICSDLTWASVLSDEEIVERIEAMLPEFEQKGLEPAIPILELKRYQELPLSQCSMEEDGKFNFQVDVPVKAHNKNYQLFNFPSGSFKFQAEDSVVCTFEYPTKGVVDLSSPSSIFPLSEEEWEACLETNLCQIPNMHSHNVGDVACLEAVFSGKMGRELIPYCKFHCQKPETVPNPRKEISESFFLSWILK